MAKVVGLKIEVEGLSSITENVVALEGALKATKEQAKELEAEIESLNEQIAASDNPEEIAELNEQLAQTEQEYVKVRNAVAETNEQLKVARKEQREFIKDAEAAKFQKGSYFQLNNELKQLRKEYKNLSEAERESAKGQELKNKINELDTELKQIDASIGQFQRNVGNYPNVLNQAGDALKRLIPGFSRFSKAITNAEGKLNAFGVALASGFIAFQGGKLLNRAIKQLDEFISKIDETRQAVAGFTDATGEQLNQLTADVSALSETFGVDAEQISKSAAALADNLGVSFDEALGLIEDRLVEGVANNEEFLSSVEEYPETFEAASGAVTDFSERNRELLESNRALAESQVEVAERLAPTVDSLKAFATTVKTVLLVALANLIDFFIPVISAFQKFGSAIGELVGSLFGFGSASNAAGKALDGLNTIAQQFGEFLVFIVDSATFTIKAIRSLGDLLSGDATRAWQLFTEEGQKAARANELVEESTAMATKAFQSEIKGLNNLFAQLKETNEGSEERAALIDKLNDQYGEYLPNIDLETAGQEELAQAYDAASRAIAEQAIKRAIAARQAEIVEQRIEAEIKLQQAIRAQAEFTQEANERTSTFLGTAQEIGKAFIPFTDNLANGAAEVRKLGNEANAAAKEVEAQKQALKDLQDSVPGLIDDLSSIYDLDALEKNTSDAAAITQESLNEQAKAAEKARKDELKRQQKLYEQLLKARKKFADEEIKLDRQRAALLADLQARLIDESIKNIEDERDRRIAEINNATQDQLDALQEQTDKLVQAQRDREAKLAETFGENSEELKASQKAFNEDLTEIQAEQAKIQVELIKQRDAEIAEVNKEFRDKELSEAAAAAEELRAFRDQALNEELAFIEQQGQLRALKQQEQLDKQLANTEDAVERERLIRTNAEAAIIDQIQTIRFKLRALEDAEDELERQQAEEGVEIKQEEYDRILLARQQLNTELAGLERQQTEVALEESQKRQAALQEQVQAASQNFSEGLTLLDGFLDAANAREQERLNAALENSQNRQDQLSSEIQDATGLRKKFLEQQLQDEVKNAEALAKKQEELQTKAAKRDKRIAVVQSIIQGALSVQRAAASPPGFPLNLPSVLLAAGFAAARTALIAAQPLATGGVVGMPGGEIVQFNTGGRVTSRGNIKPLSNGDNVLATLTTGEAVLTPEQQMRVGGPPVLRAAGVPGFANGGLIGGVPTSPTISGLQSGGSDALRAFNERTEAIRETVLKTQVILNTDDLDEDNENKERIEKRATLQSNG